MLIFKSKYKKYIEIGIGILLIISLIPIIRLSFYSRPCVDDFAYSYPLYNYIKNGNWNIFGLIGKAIEVDAHFYNTWQGLYSSAFLLAFQPGIFGEKYYCVGTMLLLLLSFLCILYFVGTLLKVVDIKENKYFIALFLFTAIFQALPSALNGLYWYNGAYNYMPFFFFILVNISLCLRYIYLDENKKKNLIKSCILSFVISGGNHVTAFLNILLLICLSYISFKKNKGKLYISLITALFGFLLVCIAPGTAIRQAELNKQGIMDTIKASFNQSFVYIKQWLNNRTLILLALVSLWSLYVFKNYKIDKSIFKLSPLIYIFIAWVILCGLLCVPYIAMGWFGAERLTNVIWLYIIFVSIMIIIYSTFYILFNFVDVHNIENNVFLKTCYIVLILLSVFYSTSNGKKAYEEVYNCTAPLYVQSFDSRLEKMKEVNNNSVIEVDALPYSYMLRFDDLTDDVNDWRNKAWESYYGVKMIVKYE